jgi:hypothetical protein
LNYQATYTWSRSMGVVSSGVRDLLDRSADYTLLGSHRTHDFRRYGIFDLPFGPGKLLGTNASGWTARLIEGWKLGTILNLNSGSPLNIGSRNTLYAAGTPDVVGAFPREGAVVWPLSEGGNFGNFFPRQYQRVADPGCSSVASNLSRWCTNTALAEWQYRPSERETWRVRHARPADDRRTGKLDS